MVPQFEWCPIAMVQLCPLCLFPTLSGTTLTAWKPAISALARGSLFIIIILTIAEATWLSAAGGLDRSWLHFRGPGAAWISCSSNLTDSHFYANVGGALLWVQTVRRARKRAEKHCQCWPLINFDHYFYQWLLHGCFLYLRMVSCPALPLDYCISLWASRLQTWSATSLCWLAQRWNLCYSSVRLGTLLSFSSLIWVGRFGN